MNKIILTGRLAKDAELRYTPGKGTPVTTFSMAVDDGFGDNKKTYFFNIVVWGKSAEAVAQYTSKGSKVLVNGKLTNRDYQAKDGTKKYVTEVVADMYNGVEFLDNKNSNNAGSNQPSNNGGMTYDDDLGEPIDDGDMPF